MPPVTCLMICDTCSGATRAVADDCRLDLLDDLGGLENGLLVAADVDLAVAGGNLGRHRVANAAEMLVAGAQQQHQLIGIADRNCRFDHQQTRRHAGRRRGDRGKMLLPTIPNCREFGTSTGDRSRRKCLPANELQLL